MLKKFAIFIIVLLVVLFLSSPKKPSSAQTDTTVLGQWQSTQPFVSNFPTNFSHPLPSFIAGDYYYVFLLDSTIKYAKINSNGSLDLPWKTASIHHHEGSGRGYTAVVINNVPYLIRFGKVEKLIINSTTGDVTEIQQMYDNEGGNIGGNWYYWNSALLVNFDTVNYVFSMGGFDCCMSPHYSTNNLIYRANALQSVWQWQEMGRGPYPRNPYKGVFYRSPGHDYGFIYISGLEQEKNPNPLYRIKVKSDGNFDGGWITIGDLPNKDPEDDNALGDIFLVENVLYVIRGQKVYSSTINSIDGSISSWLDTPPDLPKDQINKPWGPSVDGDHTDGISYGIKNNFVYVTGQDRVYYSQIGGSSNQPTNTGVPPSATNPPAATATPSPTPTFPPCPVTGTDPKMRVIFQTDRVANTANFNNSGGLQVIGVNFDNRCQVVKNNIDITYDSGSDFFSAPFQLPVGNNKGYDILLMGPRNLRQEFSGIKLTATENDLDLDCTVDDPPADCGELITKRSERKLWSGDANNDGAINLLDFELYRQNIDKDVLTNNVDFDFNGKVEYKSGVDDDFLVLKNNFGKSGIYLNQPIPRPTLSPSPTFTPTASLTPTLTRTPTLTPTTPPSQNYVITANITISQDFKNYFSTYCLGENIDGIQFSLLHFPIVCIIEASPKDTPPYTVNQLDAYIKTTNSGTARFIIDKNCNPDDWYGRTEAYILSTEGNGKSYSKNSSNVIDLRTNPIINLTIYPDSYTSINCNGPTISPQH